MDVQRIISELNFKAVRSSGAGGQNVNKVASKVVLSFDLKNSSSLTEEEKILLKKNLSSRLTAQSILILNCDMDRSQLKNKEIITNRFLKLLEKGLQVVKIRKETKVPKSVIRKRIKDKQRSSLVKQQRKKPKID